MSIESIEIPTGESFSRCSSQHGDQKAREEGRQGSGRANFR